MIAYLLFIYILGFFLSIPLILIWTAEDRPMRDTFLHIIFYPIWVTPIIVYFMIILSYCIILNRTVEEGFKEVDSKIGNWKIVKFVERFIS